MIPQNGMTRCIKCNCIEIKRDNKRSQVPRVRVRVRVTVRVTTLALTPYHRPLTVPRPGQFPCTITPRHWAAYWAFGPVTLRASDLQPTSPCWISPDILQEGFPRVVSQRVTLFRGSKCFVTPAPLIRWTECIYIEVTVVIDLVTWSPGASPLQLCGLGPEKWSRLHNCLMANDISACFARWVYVSATNIYRFYLAMHVVLARYCYRKSSVRPSVCPWPWRWCTVCV